MNPSLPHALVFDFDGVIVESADVKTLAFLELFADMPEHLTRIHEYHLQNVSLSRYAKFDWIYRELLKQPLAVEEKRALGKRFSELVLSKIMTCPFVPGVPERLAELSLRFRLYIVSGTPSEELHWITQQRGLAAAFSGIFGYPPEKPELLRALLGRLGLHPWEAIYVGDTVGDLAAARSVGMPFVARYTNKTVDLWGEFGVDMIPDISALRIHPEGRHLVEDGTRSRRAG